MLAVDGMQFHVGCREERLTLGGTRQAVNRQWSLS
jgi:hypothetical protein